MVTDETEFYRLLEQASGTGKQPGPDAIPNDVILAAPPFSKPAYTFSHKSSGPQAAPPTGGRIVTQSYCTKTKVPSWN
jgi:hypothetical protein